MVEVLLIFIIAEQMSDEDKDWYKRWSLAFLLPFLTLLSRLTEKSSQMPGKFVASTVNPNLVMEDHSYGKGGVKVLVLSKYGEWSQFCVDLKFILFHSGDVHSVKELEVSTLLTLATQKDYLEGDNSDIIATDSQKNTVYVLAKKFGVKTIEDFAILLCNHFLSTYSHVTKAVVTVEEIMWNRVSYGDHASSQKLHNHAFIHSPECTRFSTVSQTRDGK